MEQKKKCSKLRCIPNIISSIRIILIGFFAYFFEKDQYLYALIVFIIASYTDYLDGYLARKFNWITNLGKVLDPLADKLMLITVFLCLYFSNLIPHWLFWPIILKEIIMIAFGIMLYFKDIIVPADRFGKISTWLFAVSITLVLYKEAFPSVSLYNVDGYSMVVATLYALVAFGHYAYLLFAANREKA